MAGDRRVIFDISGDIELIVIVPSRIGEVDTDDGLALFISRVGEVDSVPHPAVRPVGPYKFISAS